MRIHLYNINCVNTKLNKDSYLLNEVILDGTLRDAQNKTNPVILFENVDNFLLIDDAIYDDDIEIGYSNNIDSCNYGYIEEFDRFYFITDRVVRSNKTIILSFELDSLMSFKSILNNYKFFITRRTNGNPFIIDNLIPFESRKNIYLDTSFDIINNLYNFDNIKYLDDNSYCIALNVILNPITSNPYSNIPTEFNLEYDNSRNIGDGIIPDAIPQSNFNMRNCYFFLITPKMLDKLVYNALQDDTIKSYIISIQVLPFTPESYDLKYKLGGTNVVSLKLGETTINFGENIKVIKYANNDNVLLYKKSFDLAESFRDLNPYLNYKIYLPFYKEIELNPIDVNGCDINIYYYFDYTSGYANIVIYNETRKIVLNMGQAQFTSRIELSTTNFLENNRNMLLKGIDAVTNITTGLIGGLSSGNYSSILSTSLSNSSKLIQSDIGMYNRAQVGTLSNSMATFSPMIPYVIESRAITTFDNDDFLHYANNIGLLYNHYDYLYNLNSDEHCIISDATDIRLELDMTSNELDSLVHILENGFYI